MPQTLESHLIDQTEHGRGLFWHRLRWRVVASRLPRRRPFTLLDVGAGAGMLERYLARDFPAARYAFIEPLDSLRQQLRQRAGAEADFEGRPRFQGVEYLALLDVLEHQPDDGRFLASLVEKMEPGAQLLVTVPALPQLWSAWDEGLGHCRRYTRRSLRAVLQGAGLQVLELSYLFPEMVPLGLLRRLRAPHRAAAGPELDLEMPHLPEGVNRALYGVGRVSLALRPLHLLGTSLFAATRKP